jgi:succinate-semialdehyde dehydrogenase / glutarate-semialdehyde dehydrogenase
MPWNFPFFRVIRFAAPALMAGNAALLKRSPNTSGCALAVEEALSEAGLPRGLFRALLVSDAAVGDVTAGIIGDPRVAAVTLTGSERAGTAVGEAAGRALKKSVLELGGSDPFVVLDDADIAVAARMAARARFLNGGQSCISAKRFIFAEPVADDFERRFVDAVEGIAVGNPLAEGTALGPLARLDLLEALDAQVRASVDDGARLLTGGHRLDRPGFYYAPTVLAGVRPDMPVFARRRSGRPPPSSGPATRTMRSSLPMTPRSGSAPACGPASGPSGSGHLPRPSRHCSRSDTPRSVGATVDRRGPARPCAGPMSTIAD